MSSDATNQDKDIKEHRCSRCHRLLGIERASTYLSFAPLEIKCSRCGMINSMLNDDDRLIFLTDNTGVIVFANNTTAKITGYSFAEMSGKTPALWGQQMPEALYQKLWTDILVQKKAVVVHLTNRKKDGTLYPITLCVSPILGIDGEVNYFLGVETIGSGNYETGSKSIS